jgi:GcrA cell cycle regulator
VSWTEEKIETLRRLHADGVSFALISEEVGMSRNSCIGKARRLELPMRVTVKAKNGELKPRWQKRRYVSIVRAAASGTLKVVETVETDLPQFQCDVVPLNKTLDEIGREDCRYITGDPLTDGAGIYCSHPVYKRSYCADHFARCYVEPRKRYGATQDQAISRQTADSIHGKMVSVDSGNKTRAGQSYGDLGLASETEAA